MNNVIMLGFHGLIRFYLAAPAIPAHMAPLNACTHCCPIISLVPCEWNCSYRTAHPPPSSVYPHIRVDLLSLISLTRNNTLSHKNQLPHQMWLRRIFVPHHNCSFEFLYAVFSAPSLRRNANSLLHVLGWAWNPLRFPKIIRCSKWFLCNFSN